MIDAKQVQKQKDGNLKFWNALPAEKNWSML